MQIVHAIVEDVAVYVIDLYAGAVAFSEASVGFGGNAEAPACDYFTVFLGSQKTKAVIVMNVRLQLSAQWGDDPAVAAYLVPLERRRKVHAGFGHRFLPPSIKIHRQMTERKNSPPVSRIAMHRSISSIARFYTISP